MAPGAREETSLLPFARPEFGDDEADAVRDVILSGWLTTGERCRALEQAVAETVGVSHAVALSSCTAALHLSLEAVGVRSGDLVVTSPYTFASTAEVIRHFDAVPVFVDIDPVTCNIDDDRLERAVEGLAHGDRSWLPPSLRNVIEPRAPVAVLPVHVGGIPCDLDRLYKLAARHGMAVVEDAAHAIPAAPSSRSLAWAMDHGVPATACFSFYATKPVTTGEGGMLVTNEARIADRARIMSLHGLSRDAWARQGQDDGWRYEIVAPGYKYNMTDVAAALGLVQLVKADVMRSRRCVIAERYNDAFAYSDALEVPTVPRGLESPWHLYMLRIVPERLTVGRDLLIENLRERGIGTSVHFIPLHLHRYYRETFSYVRGDFPIATREFEREISLPIYSGMSDADVDLVIVAVSELVAEAAR
jgi:perosamine synthetase